MGRLIKFNCPFCKQKLEFDEQGVGMEIPCPSCANDVKLPSQFEVDIEELWRERLVIKKIAPEILGELESLYNSNSNSLFGIICKDFTQLLLTEGWTARCQWESGQNWLERNHLGSFAPSVSVDEIPPRDSTDVVDATKAQQRYLIMLGFTDELKLSGLGKWQASKLIQDILDARERAEISNDSNE
jgi:hypothetical protein